MKLKDARLCLDCDEVFESIDGVCSYCGSSASMLLSRIIIPINGGNKDGH